MRSIGQRSKPYLLVGRQRATSAAVHGVVDAGEAAPSTRDLILTEALHCFAEHGYEGTSLNDIAAGVGIRRPSLLHHFPSKEALYGEVFERLLSDWFERLEAERRRRPSVGWAKVELVLGAELRLLRRQPRRTCACCAARRSTAVPTSASTSPPCCARCSTRAVAYFRREMAAGVFRPHDPEQLLLTGYGAVLSYFSDAPLLDGLLDVAGAVARRVLAVGGRTSCRSSVARLGALTGVASTFAADADDPGRTARTGAGARSHERWKPFGTWERHVLPDPPRPAARGDAHRLRAAMRLPYPARARTARPAWSTAVPSPPCSTAWSSRPSARPTPLGAARFTTVDMHVQFMSVAIGEDLIAEGWIVRRGRTVVFCEVRGEWRNERQDGRQVGADVQRPDRSKP